MNRTKKGILGMSQSRQDLAYIERAIQVLRYAQYNIRHQKFDRAERNVKNASHYMKKVFPNLSTVVKKSKHIETNSHNYNSYNNNNNRYIFYCYNCPPQPEPPSLTSQKFFAKVSSGTQLGNDLIILASNFVDNSGNTITSFPSGYEYMNLYVNGIIQQNGTFTVLSSALLVIGGAHLDPNDPIAIELVSQV